MPTDTDSSLRIYMDAPSAASRVRMLRDVSKGAILLVEGDKDARFFGNLMDVSVAFVIPQGKNKVRDALGILAPWHIAGVLAIVDADYWALEGTPGDQVMVTDSHDVETMLLASPALTKVVREFLSGDALATVETFVKDLRKALLTTGEPFGCLRWASERNGLRLDFSTVNPCEFVDSKDLTVRLEDFVRRVLQNTRRPVPLSDEDLCARVLVLRAKKKDLWLVCQGHDLVSLLTTVLPVVLTRGGETEAAARARHLTSTNLERQLRLAYETRFFRKTRLYAAIREWESRNPNYAVLARDE